MSGSFLHWDAQLLLSGLQSKPFDGLFAAYKVIDVGKTDLLVFVEAT